MQRNPNTFNDRAAPANYVSGLGRGANSFQTSAAHGIVSMPSFGAAPKGYVPGAGRGSGGFGDKKPESQPGGAAEAGAHTGGRFDPMLGYEQGSNSSSSGSFFNNNNNNSAEYGFEDQYADAVYQSVDEMRSRGKKTSAASSSASSAAGRSMKSIADDFADLKPGLKQVSVDDWANLPEIATSLRNKKKPKQQQHQDRFTPVTDSLLASLADRHSSSTTASTSSTSSSREDLSGLSQARDQMLRVNLDRAGDGILGQTNVDPRGFLTQLSGQLDQSSQLGDVKKARLLLKSVTSTNPVHGPGWIAAARVEEIAGKLAAAREIMERACQACADQEDVWLEASRLQATNAEAKDVLFRAVTVHLPKAVNLWLAAADLELRVGEDASSVVRTDAVGTFTRRPASAVKMEDEQQQPGADAELVTQAAHRRKQLIRKALARVPDSVKLWHSAIAMERNDGEAQQLVQQAKAACPDAVDFYLADARMERDTATAQKLLNDARRKFPGEVRIWIAACRLVEEQQPSDTSSSSAAQISQIVAQAVKRISAAAHVTRQAWLKQAEECEQEQYPVTCEAVLRHTLGLGVDEQDRLPTWRADAQAFAAHNFAQCSRVCLEVLVESFPATAEAWELLIRAAASADDKIAVLERAVLALPSREVFWLMLAKEIWKSDGGGGVERARQVLQRAFASLSSSGGGGGSGEELWFAAAKLANEVSADQASEVLAQARQVCDTERVWIKSIVHERRRMRSAGAAEEQMCRAALERFPKSAKLHLMLGQVVEEEEGGGGERARQVYVNATQVCPRSVPVWLALARVEEDVMGNVVRARAVLDNARSRIDTSARLWLAAIRLERRAGSPDSTLQNYVARALQHFPGDGALFAEQVEIADEAKKQTLAELAFKKTQGKDEHVVLCCAKLWWRKRPLDAAKVKKWLERAVQLNPRFGDAWAAYYRFVCTETARAGGGSGGEAAEAVLARCVEAAPTQGERWIRVSKMRGNESLSVDQVLKLAAKHSGPDDTSLQLKLQ